MDIIEAMVEGIKAHGACKSFEEGNLEKLVEQLFTPQGVEFVMKTGYPGIFEFREIQKQTDLKKYGIYVDAGEVTLKEERKVFLIGNTFARLEYNDCASNKVFLKYGAKAEIKASGFSVVRLEHDSSSFIESYAKDKAVILW